MLVRNQFVLSQFKQAKCHSFSLIYLLKKNTNVNVLNTLNLTNSSWQEMPPRDSKTNFMILRFQMKCNTKHHISKLCLLVMVLWYLESFQWFTKYFISFDPFIGLAFVTHSSVFNVIIALGMCYLHTPLEEENERNKWTWLYLEYIEVMDIFGRSSHVLIRDKQNQFVMLCYFSTTINILFSLTWLRWQNLLWMLKLQSNT